MAIPWLVVLSNIPWREVIVNAPKVADEAKKLWTNLNDPNAKNKPTTQAPSADAVFTKPDQAMDVAALQNEVASLTHSVDDLHHQMRESTMLIKALADQNEQLVKHIEINRSRLKLLIIIFIAFVIAAVFAFYKLKVVA